VLLVEETPSSRPDLHALVPTRRPMGCVSAAMGGLGFAVLAAVGLRMGGHRPVVAVVGDGASLYSVQALWTAAHGAEPPWPSFEEISLSALAQGFGCPARRIEDLDALLVELDEVVPSLADRHEPLVLEVAVRTEDAFQP
jgi:benzoylformate decarboxylase